MAERSLARVSADYITLVQLIAQSPGDQLADADSLRNQLLALLDSITRNSGKVGIDAAEVEQARFALAIWTDETILRSEWPGRISWPSDMLQSRLFHTTRGGNEFYERLKALNPDQQDAREIFFLALVMGFEGQYAGQPDQRNAIIAHQYKTLRAGGRGTDLNVEGPLIPSAYELDIELPRVGGLGLMATVGIGTAGLVGFYILAWLLLYLVAGDVPLPPGIS
jgi:type IV/VI secretion system ImpK/VasF family protein